MFEPEASSPAKTASAGRTSSLRASAQVPAERCARLAGESSTTAPRWKTSPSTAPRSSAARTSGSRRSRRAEQRLDGRRQERAADVALERGGDHLLAEAAGSVHEHRRARTRRTRDTGAAAARQLARGSAGRAAAGRIRSARRGSAAPRHSGRARAARGARGRGAGSARRDRGRGGLQQVEQRRLGPVDVVDRRRAGARRRRAPSSGARPRRSPRGELSDRPGARSCATGRRRAAPRVASTARQRRRGCSPIATSSHDLAERPEGDSLAVGQAAAAYDPRPQADRERNSATSRDLPTPGSPTTVSRRQSRSATTPRAALERSQLSSRPTNRRRAPPRQRADTIHPEQPVRRERLRLPLAPAVRPARPSTAARTSRRVVSPRRTSPVRQPARAGPRH